MYIKCVYNRFDESSATTGIDSSVISYVRKDICIVCTEVTRSSSHYKHKITRNTLVKHTLITHKKERNKCVRVCVCVCVCVCVRVRDLNRTEGNVLFNDTLNTFYLRSFGAGHMAINRSDSERGNPLSSQHGVFLLIMHHQRG